MFDIRLEKAFDFASAEYQELFAMCGASVFQHPLWLGPLYRDLAPAVGAEPLVVVARRRADQGLAMVLPLTRRRRRGLSFIEFADLSVSDYAEAVCDPETFERLAQDPRTPAKIRGLLQPFDVLRIGKIRDGGHRLDRLFAGARRAPMAMSAHATGLFEPFEDWRAARIPKSYGRELGRNRRHMERLGAFRFELLHEPSEIETLLLDLQAYRGRRFPGDILGQQCYFDFYRTVALTGAPTGFARAYRMSLDGVTIGGTLGLSHRRRFVGLILGFDDVEYRPRSLGALTIEDVARNCIAEQHEVLDLSIGDEHYKKLFSAEPTALWMVTASGTMLGAVADKIAAHIARPQPASGKSEPAKAAPARDVAPLA